MREEEGEGAFAFDFAEDLGDLDVDFLVAMGASLSSQRLDEFGGR